MKRIDNSTINKIREIDVKKVSRDPFLAEMTINLLMNTVDKLYMEVCELNEEVQQLKNELTVLKGEKGKPRIKPSNKKDKDDDNINPPQRKNRTKGSKKDKIKIDREEIIKIDRSTLPEDAEFKGYEEKIVQEILIKTDNVLYKREKYYSPSEHKTYTAEFPEGVEDTDFGPNLKALCAVLYFDYRITENKIIKLLEEFGITMSEGTLSNILIKENAEILSNEKSDIYDAGLKSTSYQQTDDTGFRVAGKNCYVQIVCNPYYSAYFINERKNRPTARKVIQNGSKKPVFDILISDDAGQFDKITEERGLCWVHEYRHYKKIKSIFLKNIKLIEDFKSQIKQYYEKLKAYKENPLENLKTELSEEFDKLFGTKTGYDVLDERIMQTKEKKAQLLTVLEHPEIPLHNNLSENGLREVVVKRKISSGTKTAEGSTAWENYLTISATCKKLGVNFFSYVKDIFSHKMELPRLAELINQKA